ncbi:MAG TPA: FKBP-type peptidyl-prolyl cis-trans isomerase [Polyangiaceae bacterium]|nr:FKBP-type peptidyl-prolyl cis-trans isomerase [Polyangiaceae bacterium]
MVGFVALAAAAVGACAPGGDAHGGAPAASASASASGSAPAASGAAPVEQVPPPPDLAAPPATAQRTYSGLASVVLQPGTGVVRPTREDAVAVHYTGWDKKGTTIVNSYANDLPAPMRVEQFIDGLLEGVQLMVVGEKRRFWVPARLAYTEHPFRKAPAGDLVFDVELLMVKPSVKAPPPPREVSGIPKSAKRTNSGLAYRVLKPSEAGAQSPKLTDTVEVQYTGWTVDGRMFDTSTTRSKKAIFRVNQVIKGWTEGLQLMKVGEKTRFWIPADLAYGETPSRPNSPAGMLVFDVELVAITDPGATDPHTMQQ